MNQKVAIEGCIHHVDGDPLNNAIDNLQLVYPEEHLDENVEPA